MTGAAFDRGASRQDYSTPSAFIDAVVARFGPIAFDLAADSFNAKAPSYFDEERDALAQKWDRRGTGTDGLFWLNPPYADITPWAKKCALEAHRARILLLVPAAVGSNWWREWVHGRAGVLFLNGRLSFDGKNPYPKDCCLALYGIGVPGYDVWAWRVAT